MLEISNRESGVKSVKKSYNSSSNVSENFTLLANQSRDGDNSTIYNINNQAERMKILSKTIEERRKEGKKIDLGFLSKMLN